MLAGGIESMTNAPYLLPKARAGLRMGHARAHRSHVLRRPAEPVRRQDDGLLRRCDREEVRLHARQQDEFAAESVRRALAAVEKGYFDAEVAPVTVKDRKGERVVAKDETPFTCDIAKIPEPEAGVQQGRHRDGGELLVDLGRRRGAASS